MEELHLQFKSLKFKDHSKNLVNNLRTPNLVQLSKLFSNQLTMLIQLCLPDLEENSKKSEMNQLKVLLTLNKVKLINLPLTMNSWESVKLLLTKPTKELLKTLPPLYNAFKILLTPKLLELKEKLILLQLKPILYLNQLDGMLFKLLLTPFLLK